jgi:CRP/FNR family transcriptional regulator, nitrogen fixation regulation protein
VQAPSRSPALRRYDPPVASPELLLAPGKCIKFLRKFKTALNLHPIELTTKDVLKNGRLFQKQKLWGRVMLEVRNQHSIGKSEPPVVIGERIFWSEFKYREGSEVFAETETADYTYQILSGAVRTFKLLPDGRRQIGAFYFPGDIFGIEDGDVHRFTAEAVVDTKVLIAKRARVFEESDESLAGTRDLLKLVARTLEHAENHLLLLGRQTSIERVAAFLVEMDRRLQSPGEMILPMTRRDIADYLGLTIESVSRALSVFRRDGLLSFRGYAHRHIVLHHRSRLAELANSSRS